MPPDSALSFNALLKRLRRAASLTQMELATRGGFSTVYARMSGTAQETVIEDKPSRR